MQTPGGFVQGSGELACSPLALLQDGDQEREGGDAPVLDRPLDGVGQVGAQVKTQGLELGMTLADLPHRMVERGRHILGDRQRRLLDLLRSMKELLPQVQPVIRRQDHTLEADLARLGLPEQSHEAADEQEDHPFPPGCGMGGRRGGRIAPGCGSGWSRGLPGSGGVGDGSFVGLGGGVMISLWGLIMAGGIAG